MAQALFNPTHLAANGGTTCKTGRGILTAIVINTKGSAGNTCTVYDNTAASGTVIAIIDTTAAIGTLLYDCFVTNGVHVVLATGGAADITVVTD